MPADLSTRLRAVAYVGLLVGAALFFEIGQDLDTGLSEVLESFPGFSHTFWLAGFWVTLAWTVTQVVAVVVKRRWLLAVECIAAALLAFASRSSRRQSSTASPTTSCDGSWI